MHASVVLAWLFRLILVVLLIFACVTDARSRRIPNAIPVSGLVLAFIWHGAAAQGAGLFAGSAAGGLGLVASATGGLWQPFYSFSCCTCYVSWAPAT